MYYYLLLLFGAIEVDVLLLLLFLDIYIVQLMVFYVYTFCSHRTFNLQMRTGEQVSDLTEKINVTVPIAFAAKVKPS